VLNLGCLPRPPASSFPSGENAKHQTGDESFATGFSPPQPATMALIAANAAKLAYERRQRIKNAFIG
jgi:hypothetical protein